MQKPLVVGSVETIVALINAFAGPVRVVRDERQHGVVTRVVFGDDSEVRAHYAMIEAGMDKIPSWDRARTRQERLIECQKNSGRVSERPFSLATNIYGWCVGSTLLSNLQGGPFAHTQRGATLEDCFRFGLHESLIKGTTFSFIVDNTDTLSIKLQIPSEVVEAVIGRASSLVGGC